MHFEYVFLMGIINQNQYIYLFFLYIYIKVFMRSKQSICYPESLHLKKKGPKRKREGMREGKNVTCKRNQPTWHTVYPVLSLQGDKKRNPKHIIPFSHSYLPNYKRVTLTNWRVVTKKKSIPVMELFPFSNVWSYDHIPFFPFVA